MNAVAFRSSHVKSNWQFKNKKNIGLLQPTAVVTWNLWTCDFFFQFVSLSFVANLKITYLFETTFSKQRKK